MDVDQNLLRYVRCEEVVRKETAQEPPALGPKVNGSGQDAIPVQSMIAVQELSDIADPFQLEPHILCAVHAQQNEQVLCTEAQDSAAGERL